MTLRRLFIAVLSLTPFWLSPSRLAADGRSETGPATAEHPVAPELPSIPSRIFDVKSHGAIGDGLAADTRAIQSAIDAAAHGGGGTVEFPAGTYLCGPLHLASRIELQLDAGAILLMLPFEKYPGGTEAPENFLIGSDLHDVAITGRGKIDGQGAPWWPLAKTPGVNRPRMIALSHCDRVLIAGVTLQNSPMFHIAIGGNSSDVTVRGVTIRAPASTDPITPSHNTDACDVTGHRVLIEDCDVSVGDDNFTCGGGTSDVLIRHCTYGYGHGVSIGSHTAGGVSNLTVVDCTFNHTEAGIRIKSDRDRGGVVQHLVYENLRMTDVGVPILIYGAYLAPERQYRDLNRLTAETAARYPAKPVTARTPIYRDITFRNITAAASKGRRAGLIWGLPEAPVTAVRLENVRIVADLPFGIFNASQVTFENCEIATATGLNRFATANAQITTAPR